MPAIDIVFLVPIAGIGIALLFAANRGLSASTANRLLFLVGALVVLWVIVGLLHGHLGPYPH